ncbi:MAG: amino acid adenylation domain-containing protein [Pseudomonadota bacterium]
MTSVAEKLAGLSADQRQLLLKRMRERQQDGQQIPRRTGDGPAPLSFTQRRLWFVQALSPQDTAYNMATVLRLNGPLHEAVMREAFSALVARHQTLRTRFETSSDGEPVQLPGNPPILETVDVSGLAEPESEARGIVRDLTLEPYDLRRVPVRAKLLRLSDDDHIFAFGLHHISGDRQSTGILAHELALLYGSFDQGETSPLPPLPIQMVDFATWQRTSPETRLENQVSYWCDKLADAPLLDVPRLPNRSADREKGGGVYAFEFDPRTVEAARLSARRYGVSLYTLLLAAFKLLLMRYCNTADIVVGSDVSHRDRPETQRLVGPLVKTLALRTNLSNAENFVGILRATETSFHEALRNQDVPLEQIIEALSPDRRPDEIIPIFRAKFDLQQAERLPGSMAGLRLSRIPMDESTAKYELRLNLEDDGERITGRVEYRADFYDQALTARFAAHYLTLLQSALAQDKAPPANLKMLSEDERSALLDLSEGPPLPRHSETLHESFEAQVDRTPNAAALTHQGHTLTYAQLDGRANAVAQKLISMDLPQESLIGICMSRAPDLVAAILGVLKAGHAYVPLDPAYPRARLDMISDDASLKLIIGDETTAARVSPEVEFLTFSNLDHAPRPGKRARGSSLAVVIYTSGTTGIPKGVMLEHRNILARVAWARESFEPADLSKMLFGTSVSFDLSLFEIFVTLGLGGELVHVDTVLDLPHLPEGGGVTFLNTVPSLLRELLRHADLPTSLRAVNLAGEFFPASLLDDLLKFPQIRLINNLYGPTEDAIYDAGNAVQDEPERPLPIGRPFPGAQIHILDRNGALLPRGVTGEIWVGGAGLARGYLNRDTLTREKFRTDVAEFGEGTRLYRTGDLGRWREDGRLDILGRIDTQVKIRGQRIEIGEIEATLESHECVSEAAVVVTGSPSDPDRKVAAFVAMQSGRTLASGELRDWAKGQLPPHMLPGLWDIQDKLPRMPNGKIDRRALNPEDAAAGSTYVAPGTETERAVLALWSELLGRENIGVEDDFFASGGHSLLGMRLVIRMQQTFDVDINLGALFDALTPRKQGALIDDLRASRKPSPVDDFDPTAGLTDAEVDALLSKMAD